MAVRALVPGSAVGVASLLLWVVGVGALVLAAQWVAAFRGRPPFLAFLPDVGPMVMTLWFARSLVLCAVVGGLLTARAAHLGVLGPSRGHPAGDGGPVLVVGSQHPAVSRERAPGLTAARDAATVRAVDPRSVARGFAAYPRDVRIDVWSDILCPFCHLGRRHLELALEQFEHGDEVGVVWHSFQLDRTAPAVDDTPAIDRVAEKYGVPREQMVAQHERMAVDAAAVGLDFQWGTLRGGNSYDAHRLIHLARALGREDEVTARVMRAWYSEGQSIGDPETLVRLGVEGGLDEAAVRDLLAGDDHGIDVRTDLALASQIGITSVPTFVLDQKFGVSGAQPVEVMLNAIRQVWDLQGTEPEPVAESGGCGGGCCGGACGSGRRGRGRRDGGCRGAGSRDPLTRRSRSPRAPRESPAAPSWPARVRVRGHPAYLEEPTCPCCIPALGEFGGVPPRGVPGTILRRAGGIPEIRGGRSVSRG